MGKLVFVVDDNDANLTMAALALEAEYDVLTMPSAEKMFSLLRKKRPDLILLDVEMPVMGGMEAIAALKGDPQWNGIPVIFITGRIDDGLLSDAAKAGALEVLDKKNASVTLLGTVKKHI